jgi:hypothetical protein
MIKVCEVVKELYIVTKIVKQMVARFININIFALNIINSKLLICWQIIGK